MRKRSDAPPHALLTLLRDKGHMIALTPYDCTDWLDLSMDSAGHMIEYVEDECGIMLGSVRIEAVNDLQFIDLCMFDENGECVARMAFSKISGLCEERIRPATDETPETSYAPGTHVGITKTSGRHCQN